MYFLKKSNIVFEEGISKGYEIYVCNSENIFFGKSVLEMYFCVDIFDNNFFLGAIFENILINT